MKRDVNEVIISKNDTIKEAMRKIDASGLGVAFIVDDSKKLAGVITDGIIRRAILEGVDINDNVETISNKDPVYMKSEQSKEDLIKKQEVRDKLPASGPLKIPVLDEEMKVIDIAFLSRGRASKVLKASGNKGSVKKVLVVGGAGYLGSVICRLLLDKNYKVRVLDNLMNGDHGISDLYDNEDFEFIEGDMRNIQTVTDAIRGVDAVIQLAAIVGDPASALNPKETIEINYLGTRLLADICKYNQINRFIFASTCSVYGASPTPDQRLDENSDLNPVSLYADMKLKSEDGIFDLMDENFSPTVLRMATLYGPSPRMRFDLVVNILTAKAVSDGEITIFGGEQWRPLLHVEDAARAYIECLEAPLDAVRGEIFNVGSNSKNYQIKKVGDLVHNVIPEAKVITEKTKEDERNYNISFDKITRVLGYNVEHDIEDGASQIKDKIENGIYGHYTEEKYSNYKLAKNILT